jgi:hypothetical protein
MWIPRDFPALPLTLALAAVCSAFPSNALRAQTGSGSSSMVVDIPQDDLYHHPTCSLVRAAGSKVKVMRHGEAARRGMKPHDCTTEDGSVPDPNAATVYVQDEDTRYHKEGCEKLTAAAKKTTLDEAGKKRWPCPVCKPPKRTAAAAGAK